MAMKDLVIFGAGDIAQVAAFYFESDSARRVVAFVVDAAYRKAESFEGRPLVALE
jgi:saccharopine dehydrogenase-like NADP-dependent oxidoreductase